ncbi:uncharacterized protein LOC128292684 [Gossypium arboreum]|uniref:uncharacterized protein LOC128292684 n=1 Tax=Gossypium arboreum TaxID=29729 RepID=UPI0022F17D4E|nr:uncharacterized protein LOC128292684 [Gossypium arboreum]
MVATEYERCVQFEDGLRDNLRVLITPERKSEFSVLVEKAQITEEVKRIELQNRDRERVRVGPSISPTGTLPYGHCSRRHLGECWRMTGACLRCGSTEHSVRECLLRADQMQALGSSAALPLRVVQQPPRGTPIESTSSEVTVVSPLGKSIQVNKLYRDVLLEVQGTVFLADLMELLFGEFNLILGMDWLVKHRLFDKKGVINLRQRFKLAKPHSFNQEKLVRKGCEAYLAYVSVSDSGDLTVKDIKTFRNFPNVFPKELSAPVSIAPYRMAPMEPTKLKAQIQELLDRNYQRFVEEFSLIAALLTKLLHKGVPFVWTDAQ